MNDDRTIYCDVSHDPEAIASACQALELRDAFIDLGFSSLTFIEARVQNPPALNSLDTILTVHMQNF